MKLGCIGDDFTGSSDLGLMLRDQGMVTVQYIGTPTGNAPADVEAGVVALKSRSIDAQEAVRLSLEAYEWLKSQGCTQFYFKYCSTFDSTPKGNIGPVLEALIKAIAPDHPVMVCPAFPKTGRSLYQGHLFVGDRLLNESGMENHPITPMKDADIRRWLALQTVHQVGHVSMQDIVVQGIETALVREHAAGRRLVVCDAVTDADLLQLGAAAKGHVLISGGSGLALGLPKNHGCARGRKPDWQGGNGPVLALCGSCSQTSLAQITHHRDAGHPVKKVTVAQVIAGEISAQTVLDWAMAQEGVPLVYSSETPDEIARNQTAFGAEKSAQILEQFFADMASAAVARGIVRLIAAGGETSGAVVGALNADALEIGPMIDPGVPAIKLQGQNLFMALKSGNFGAPDFFEKAARILEKS